MPRGDKQQIMTYPVVLPSEEELAGFNTIASPLLEQIYSNRAENKRLSILRAVSYTHLRFLISFFGGLFYVSEENAVCTIIPWLRADLRKTSLVRPDCLYDS